MISNKRIKNFTMARLISKIEINLMVPGGGVFLLFRNKKSLKKQ
jgi:hypothetical protein